MGLRVTRSGLVKHDSTRKVRFDCEVEMASLAIPDASIESADIADASITAAKLATDAVETAKIKDLNVTTGKIAALAVTTAKINALAVTDAEIAAGAVTTAKILAGNVTLPKLDFKTGAKWLAADGVDSSGGDTQVTLTGTAIGDRVIAIFGHVKANTGAHTFLIPVIGTDFEATITVTNKIIQKQAAGHLEDNTYLFLIHPATA